MGSSKGLNRRGLLGLGVGTGLACATEGFTAPVGGSKAAIFLPGIMGSTLAVAGAGMNSVIWSNSLCQIFHVLVQNPALLDLPPAAKRYRTHQAPGGGWRRPLAIYQSL